MPRGSWMSSGLCSKALQAQVQGSFCFRIVTAPQGKTEGMWAHHLAQFKGQLRNEECQPHPWMATCPPECRTPPLPCAAACRCLPCGQ